MSKRFLIVLRHAPYGRLDAGEAVRHLNGAAANGLDASLLLLEDGVYLARAGQSVQAGWTDLSAALTQTLIGKELVPGASQPTVYVDAAAMEVRGLAEADLVPGCRLADDQKAARLVAAADASLVY